MPEDHNGRREIDCESSDQREESWAQRIGNSAETHMNKNILEVLLEKDNKGAFSVSDVECAKLLTKIGLDLRPGIHIEGVQVCPNGRGIILVTLRDSVPAENYSRYDVVEVTESGIRAIMIKPAGKKDVVMTLKGVHPNTKDSFVINYLTKFGTIPQTRVVYGTYKDGPLKGMFNGDRFYEVEIKPGVNIGSYHLIDGVKVTLRYAGQKQTCGRCHRTPDSCKGGGVAKRCEAQGGNKVDFRHYIRALWQDIDYSPENNQEFVDDDINTAENFTPTKVQTFPIEKFTGVNIKHFPKEVDHGEIIEFLCANGLPADKKESVRINSNGRVHVADLDSYIVEYIINSVHGKIKFGRKLYCNGVVPLTPEKSNPLSEDHLAVLDVPRDTLPASDSNSVAQPVIQQNQSSNVGLGIENLVRRHSLSLLNRTPPSNSLAADLLKAPPRADFQKTSEIIEDLKNMTGRLSDFASCISSSDASNDDSIDEKEENDGFKTVKERKRNKKCKRKFKPTSPQDSFLKKPHLVQQDQSITLTK